MERGLGIGSASGQMHVIIAEGGNTGATNSTSWSWYDASIAGSGTSAIQTYDTGLGGAFTFAWQAAHTTDSATFYGSLIEFF
jgi:hypothetical protein